MHFFLFFTRNVYVRDTLRLFVMIVLAIAAGLSVLLALYLPFRKQRFSSFFRVFHAVLADLPLEGIFLMAIKGIPVGSNDKTSSS